MTTVVKLGGELLEDSAAIHAAAAAIVRLAAAGPLVVVHGGGRAIDAELRARGLEPHFVDGLRVTDSDALDAVVSVLAGRNNTALVAALGAAGARAVGLTGADASIGRSRLAGNVTARSTAARGTRRAVRRDRIRGERPVSRRCRGRLRRAIVRRGRT